MDESSKQLTLDEAMAAQGQARRSDPATSHEAAKLVRAKATTARVRLLWAHSRSPEGLTDEEAAKAAGLSLTSEYATRCSELERAGMLESTGQVRAGAAGAQRMVRRITDAGLGVMAARRAAQ